MEFLLEMIITMLLHTWIFSYIKTILSYTCKSYYI